MYFIRKNRHQYSSQASTPCGFQNYGVDLNSNYDYQWGVDNAGSSGELVCADNYRGPSAFSEPETQAVKALIDRWPQIKTAINMHAYGNAFVHPMNYISDPQSDELKEEYPKADAFYKAVWTSGLMPEGMMWGNMAGVTNYPVNGGASDYMLATHNIYAITALLGTSDVFSQDFYI